MIHGFRVDTENGTVFGVCRYGPEVPDSVIIDDIAIGMGVDPERVSIEPAADLIDVQYGGIAYLTTEAL